jgi:membrane protein DedA with SNARE-associated domain
MLAGIVSDFTDWIQDVSANWWFIAVILVVALLDSVIPVVPSETTVIIGGIAAGQGNQNLAVVILAGAAGAFLGDNLAYSIGNRFEGPVRRWAEKRPARTERLESAGRQIRQRGGLLLITARFIPGGRTILTVSSGITHQPRRWFAGWVAVAALIWATYAASLGFAFGQQFEDNHAMAFWLAFGTALGITALIELLRWARAVRRARIESQREARSDVTVDASGPTDEG